MGRPVNPNVPEAGFVSKKEFLDKGNIVDKDLAVVDFVDNSKKLVFDVSGISHGTTVTIQAPSTGTVILGSGDQTQVWTKYTKTYSDFSTAATTNSIVLVSLPAKNFIHQIVMHHTTAFAGTSITAYTVSIGVSGSLSKYASAFDVFQSVSNTTATKRQVSTSNNLEDFASSANILITATSTGANLSAGSAGSVDIYVLSSVLP